MSQLRPAILIFVLLTLLTGVAYPLIVTAVGQLLFSYQANGSLIEHDGHRVASELVGQPFASSKYFWSRPSATGPQAYNGGASSGSNQGPLNPALEVALKERIAALHAADPGNEARVPVDLVTASASGLDPHISPAAATYQVNRVAKARAMDPRQVSKLVQDATEARTLGILGEPRVNVVKLNLLLDQQETR